MSLRSEGLPQLSIAGAVVVVAGLVIGAGIFKTPALIAGLVEPTQIVWIWVAAAVLSLVGALCYVELITRFPNARGEIGFLSDAFGPRVAFVYGWAKVTVINPGAIAMLAFVLADYWLPLWAWWGLGSAWFAALLVIALTALNLWGLQSSARFQMVLLTIEVGLLVGLSVASLALSPGEGSSTAQPGVSVVSPSLSAIGLAMIFALLTFGGWNEAAYLVQDIKGGGRRILLVLVLSLALITAVYLLVNAALIHLFGATRLSQSKAPIADLASAVLGTWGTGIVLVVVSASILTSVNATMVVGARATSSMAEGWSRLQGLAAWNTARGTPTRALVLQCLVSLSLVTFASASQGAFAALVEFTAPVYWGFLSLVGVSLLILRRRAQPQPGLRLALGPLMPLVFIASSGYLTYSSLGYAESQGNAWISLAVIGVGTLISLLICRSSAVSSRSS